MSLADYFEHVKGTGILATSDSDGNVDLAIYARPHVMDKDTVAFIMSPRLSYENVQSNPKAAYMFIEQSEEYLGKRLYLEKVREEDDPQLMESLRRHSPKHASGSNEGKHVVFFRVVKTRPLIGG